MAGAAPHFPGDRPLDIEHIRLDLWVELENEYVRAQASIVGTARRSLDSVQLDAVDFQEVAVEVRYSDLETERPTFEYDDKLLTIPFMRTLQPGDRVEIVVTYTLNEPKRGLHFFGPSDADPDAPYVMWSQGQSTSNRNWIPCLDHPNEMQTTEISCTVDRPYIAISNGKLLKVIDNADDTRTFHWKMSEPHVSYLVALVVGDFASKTETWQGKPVTYFVRKKFEPWIDNTFGNTLAMLDFFSEKIGVPYPWEKYDQVCCYNFGGGMENTTCTILGESTLHDDRAHLDTSSDGLVAHELGHQWFGDLLTCNEWAHLWLNEGFASYCEALWDEENMGTDAFALNMLEKSEAARERGADKPVVHSEYKSTGEQFDARAYSKGAWILHMIRRRLGDDMFWKAINAYVTRFRHQTVETRDFQRVLEDVSGESFGRFFYDWTRRAGHPKVNVAYEWLPDDKLAKIVVRQKQSSEAFCFPLKVEFVLPEGDSHEVTLDIAEKKALMYVPMSERPVALRVDPDQAVLMDLTEEKPLDLWQAQLSDTSAALRIAAVRHLAEEASDASIARLAARLPEEPFWGVQVEIAERLGMSYSGQAQQALLNGLAIKQPKALAAVVEALGEYEDESDVVEALARLVKNGHESYRVEAAAISAYSNVCPPTNADAVALFQSCLTRDSHQEMVREAAFEALGRHGGASVIDELISWTSADKASDVRAAAMRALGDVADGDEVSEETRADVLSVLRDALGSENRRVARAAIDAAEDMGQAAKPLTEALTALSEQTSSRLSWAAKRALERVNPKRDADKTAESLRERVKELEHEIETLRDKLKRAAALESPHVAHGAGDESTESARESVEKQRGAATEMAPAGVSGQ